MDQYGFVWVWSSKVWYKTAALAESEVKRRFPNYFWFHPPVHKVPFTRWVNDKLKNYTSYLYLTFSIMFKSTLLYPVSQHTLRSWWQQPFGKTWVLQYQNRAMTRISRKTRSSRQHALFLRPVKLMSWVSNLFFHLIEIILMAYLQTCRCWGKIYYHIKNNFLYTLLIYSFYIVFCLTKQVPI